MFNTPILLCCLCSIFTLAPQSIKAMTAEQSEMIKKEMETIGMECIKDFPVSEKEIADLKSMNPDAAGDGLPCFLACMMKKIGVLDDQGLMQKETALEKAKTVFSEEEKLKKISDYLHTCYTNVNSVAVTDGAKGCERAMLAYKCMVENKNKFGIEF